MVGSKFLLKELHIYYTLAIYQFKENKLVHVSNMVRKQRIRLGASLSYAHNIKLGSWYTRTAATSHYAMNKCSITASRVGLFFFFKYE